MLTHLRLRRHALPLLVSLALSGCVQPRNTFERLSPDAASAQAPMTGEQVKQRVTGYTFLRNYGGRSNEVLFFAPNNVVYQWVSGRPTLATSTWTVDLRSMRPTESADPYICTTLPSGSDTGIGLPSNPKSRCIDPALLFIPATEHAKGDVFGLSAQSQPPAGLGPERTTIRDVKRTVAGGA